MHECVKPEPILCWGCFVGGNRMSESVFRVRHISSEINSQTSVPIRILDQFLSVKMSSSSNLIRVESLLVLIAVLSSPISRPASSAPVEGSSSSEPKWIKTDLEDPYADILDEIIAGSPSAALPEGGCEICRQKLDRYYVATNCRGNHQFHEACYKQWADEVSS